MADKAPTREEMDKLYESFKDETPPGVMLPMGKEGTKKIMKKLKKIRGMELGGEAKPLVGGQKKLDKNKDGRISGDDFAMMEMGGKVEEYGGGGSVKGGKMSCRGMGAALRGGGFKIS